MGAATAEAAKEATMTGVEKRMLKVRVVAHSKKRLYLL